MSTRFVELELEKKEEKQENPSAGVQTQPKNVVREVQMGHKVVKLLSVSDDTNEFEIDFFLFVQWKLNCEEPITSTGEPVQNGAEVPLQNLFWNPKIKFKNDMNVQIKATKFMPGTNKTGERVINGKYTIQGTFFHRLELGTFPFDEQNLVVLIDSDWSCNDVVFKPKQGHKTELAYWRWEQAEWSFPDVPPETTFEILYNKSGSGKWFCDYLIKVPIKRHSGFYLSNTIVAMFLMLVCTASTFVIATSDFADRMSINVTSALTVVAFKLLMTEKLPRISYWTILDFYFMVCLGLLVLVILENALAASSVLDPDQRDVLEQITLYAFCGVALFVTVAFYLASFGIFKYCSPSHETQHNKTIKRFNLVKSMQD